MFELTDIPCWYGFIAMVASCYQAYRGFRFQWVLGIDKFKGTDRVVLLCLADTFTYFVCTLSGFVSLFAFYHLGF